MSIVPKSTQTLEFGNLPLIEVAVRASFGAPIPLTFSLVNIVANALKPDFLDLKEPEQIEVAPGIKQTPIQLGAGQLFGAVFAGNQEGLLVTLQRQVIVVRWVWKQGETAPQYPRFDKLGTMLWRTFDAVSNVLGADTPPITVVNMSYVNFLKLPHDNSVLAYFSDSAQVKVAVDSPALHKIESSWQDRAANDLRFNLEHIEARVGDETVEGYQLTTVAGSLVMEPDAKAVLVKVHDRLQKLFLDLLSPKAKDEWQLKENIT